MGALPGMHRVGETWKGVWGAAAREEVTAERGAVIGLLAWHRHKGPCAP